MLALAILSPCPYSFPFALWKNPIIFVFLCGKDWLILESTVPVLVVKKGKELPGFGC